MRRVLSLLLLVVIVLPQSGCFGYRLVRPSEIDVPNYEPRDVPIPAECEGLIRRAADGQIGRLTEAEARTLGFCQHQQLIRAQEEEAASRKLEAHAAAASLALQVTTVVVGGLIAVIAWVF